MARIQRLHEHDIQPHIPEERSLCQVDILSTIGLRTILRIQSQKRVMKMLNEEID